MNVCRPAFFGTAILILQAISFTSSAQCDPMRRTASSNANDFIHASAFPCIGNDLGVTPFVQPFGLRMTTVSSSMFTVAASVMVAMRSISSRLTPQKNDRMP